MSKTPDKKETNFTQIIEDYKEKYSEKFQKMTENFNFKLKEKDIGFETRLAEITEEYNLRMTEFYNKNIKYRK